MAELISTSSCVVALEIEVAPHTWAYAVLALMATRPSGNSLKRQRPSAPVLVLCAAENESVQTGAVQLRERTRTKTGKSAAGTCAPEIISSTRPDTENDAGGDVGGDGEVGCIDRGELLDNLQAAIDRIAHSVTPRTIR
jgi:hypothetical protein